MNASDCFDQAAWRIGCERIALRASKGCGLSYELFVSRFSAEIEAAAAWLPEASRTAALKLACEWGYATPAELDEMWQVCAAAGCCNHGIELGCCPAGCGSS